LLHRLSDRTGNLVDLTDRLFDPHHSADRDAGGIARPTDVARDFFRGSIVRSVCQRLDLGGDDGKAFAGVACAGRFPSLSASTGALYVRLFGLLFEYHF
jgi:hypothetical protein